nr:uncharacterized protein LOC124814012 [Hydra vulgaris]
MTKKCKACEIWEKHRGTEAYNTWFSDHDCDINHTKSAGSMESEGAVHMFNRSESKYNLRYNNYIGDGDSSSFKRVVESKPYGDAFIINKLKCLHGQTQNVNECLNGIIWARCPKSTYCSRKVLTIGVCSAIISFNDGINGIGNVFDCLDIPRGSFFEQNALKSDNHRVIIHLKQSSNISK